MAKDLLSINRQFTNGKLKLTTTTAMPFDARLLWRLPCDTFWRLPCAPPSLGTLNPNHTIFLYLSNHHVVALGHGSSVLGGTLVRHACDNHCRLVVLNIVCIALAA